MDKTVLLIGATAGTGTQLANKLLNRNVKLRILARNREKAQRLFGHSKAEIFISDLAAPNPSFYEAFNGVGHIVFTAAVPPGLAREERLRRIDYGGVLHALDAAKKVGFSGRFYYMNTIGLYHRTPFIRLLNLAKTNLVKWRIEAENAIRSSGLSWTIVRAGILKNAPAGRKPVQISKEDIPIRFFSTPVSRADVAEVFLACMQEPATVNKEVNVVWGGKGAPVREQLKAFQNSNIQ